MDCFLKIFVFVCMCVYAWPQRVVVQTDRNHIHGRQLQVYFTLSDLFLSVSVCVEHFTSCTPLSGFV